MRWIKNILLSVGCVYVLIGSLSFVYVKDHSALGIAKLRTLNRLMPPLTALVETNRSSTQIDSELLEKYTFYYRKVADYLPNNPNATFMLGYCLALGDDTGPAIKALEDSIAGNPHYFWAHYNLGVMQLRHGDFAKAEEAFQEALAVNPTTTVKIIFSSKVFQQLLAQVADPQAIIPPGLKAGYQDCHRWLAVIKRLKALSQKDLPSQIYNQLQPIIF